MLYSTRISKEDFELLCMIDKLLYLLEKGEELCVKQNDEFIVKLFLMNDFFVELWYQPSTNKIKCLDVLDPVDVQLVYGNQIDISDIF
jgi:hypothetical protein